MRLIKQPELKAAEIWDGMTDSEKHGVQFGLFPADKMQAAEKDGFDGHALAVALMYFAKTNHGERA
jgi:hypothetical protein